MMEISIAMGEAIYLLMPCIKNNVKKPRLTTTPEAPTMANLIKVFKLSNRIHQALRMNSMMSLTPSLDFPALRSKKSTGISTILALSTNTLCKRAI